MGAPRYTILAQVVHTKTCLSLPKVPSTISCAHSISVANRDAYRTISVYDNRSSEPLPLVISTSWLLIWNGMILILLAQKLSKIPSVQKKQPHLLPHMQTQNRGGGGEGLRHLVA